jgi:hypothetical protein
MDDLFLRDVWRYLHRPNIVRLSIDNVSIELIPHMEIKMSVTLSVGHTLQMAIAFLDQAGNPMLTTPTPDTAPTWSNTTSATETLVDNGLTCVGTPVAAGSDTVSVNLAVGGVSFSATLRVTVQAATQVLTSIAIIPTVV